MYSKTVVVGRCGRNPELRYTGSGVAVADVSIAEDRGFGDNKKTIWWRASFWRDAAETVNQHVKKGDVLIVEGVVDASAYSAQDGSPRASLELTAHAWRFGGGKRDAAESGAPTEDGEMPF